MKNLLDREDDADDRMKGIVQAANQEEEEESKLPSFL
jgi:hypothetical protein